MRTRPVRGLDGPAGIEMRLLTGVGAPGSRPAFSLAIWYRHIMVRVSREDAFGRMKGALEELTRHGFATTPPLHTALMREPTFLAGAIGVHHRERLMAGGWFGPATAP